jgi:uncharacterized membrane protein HdeD (DUF308 family)
MRPVYIDAGKLAKHIFFTLGRGGLFVMLFQELGKMKRTWIMSSIILMVIGIGMLICPDKYMGLMVSALGYVLLVVATVFVLDFLASKKALINYVFVTIGLIIGLLGLFVEMRRADVLPMLSLIFGLILLVDGISELFNAFVYARRAGKRAWWALGLLSMLTILFGVLLFINPFWDTPAVLKVVIGVMMLFSSVVSIIRTVLTWPVKTA